MTTKERRNKSKTKYDWNKKGRNEKVTNESEKYSKYYLNKREEEKKRLPTKVIKKLKILPKKTEEKKYYEIRKKRGYLKYYQRN